LAKSVGIRILDGKSVSIAERALYGLGNLLVYGPLRNNLGLSRTRLAYTAGEAIGPEIFSFFDHWELILNSFTDKQKLLFSSVLSRMVKLNQIR